MQIVTSTAEPVVKKKISFWSPEMAHDVIETSDFLWGSRICDTVVAVIVGLLLIDHIYYTYCSKTTSVQIESNNSSGNRTASNSRSGTQRKRVRTGSSMLYIYLFILFNYICM